MKKRICLICISAALAGTGAFQSLAALRQDASGYYWEEEDGSLAASQWREIGGKWYYFGADGHMAADQWIDGKYYVGGDGAMYVDTMTPDGWNVGDDGRWIESLDQWADVSQKTKRVSQDGVKGDFSIGKVHYHERMQYAGKDIVLLDKGEFLFRYESSRNQLDPSGHEIWVSGLRVRNGELEETGKSQCFLFEYDKDYSLDFTGTGMDAEEFYHYCRENDLVIRMRTVDTANWSMGRNRVLTAYMKYR